MRLAELFAGLSPNVATLLIGMSFVWMIFGLFELSSKKTTTAMDAAYGTLGPIAVFTVAILGATSYAAALIVFALCFVPWAEARRLEDAGYPPMHEWFSF